MTTRNLVVEILEEFAEAQGLHRATKDLLPSIHGGRAESDRRRREWKKARGLCIHCRQPARVKRDGDIGTECLRHHLRYTGREGQIGHE